MSTSTGHYFEKPALDLSGKRLIVVFTAYNEAERIPFFLEYYRHHGVEHFLAIDNNSSDNTAQLLNSQPDITYFHTTSSYVESKAGRLWTSELAEHYCNARWCLTLDLDELLVFPGCEELRIRDMCDYLDVHGYEGIFTVFLDMYSGRPLSEAVYTPGQSYLDVCDYFEINGYSLTQPMHFPHVGVFGGPRQRIFWEQGRRGKGPSMRKMPLVKWQSDFRYLYSTHSSTPINLADITGALLHFKFFSSFGSFAEREMARGDRPQAADYENYARLAGNEAEVVFRNSNSIHYESSTMLVENGVMVCTARYLNWVRPRLNQNMRVGPARKYDRRLRDAMKRAASGAVLRLSQLPLVWSLLASSSQGNVIAVRDRTILGWFLDRAGGGHLTRQIEARIEGEVVAVGRIGISIGQHAVVDADYAEGLFEVTIPDSVFRDRAATRVNLVSQRDAIPFASAYLKRSPEIAQDDDYQGICYVNARGNIGGWVWCPEDSTRRVVLTLHVDGQFWCRTVANRFRKNLVAKGIGDGSYGFMVSLPEWLSRDAPHLIHVTVHGTNIELQNSPLQIEIGASDLSEVSLEANWEESKGAFFAAGTRFHKGLAGQVLAVRRGTIYGWLADASDPNRILELEMMVGDVVKRVVKASATLSVISDLPEFVRGHCFAIPVFAPWSVRGFQPKRRHVSLRIRETGDMLVEELSVAAPHTRMEDSPYRGYCDPNEQGVLHGWAWRFGYVDDKVEVAVFIDGKLLTRVRAGAFREDLVEHGIGRGYHGFSVDLPRQFQDGTTHSIDAVIAEEGIPLPPRRLRLSGHRVGPSNAGNIFVRMANRAGIG